ncbi:MAG TPA: hypothetical protein VF072_15515 [Thermoleophilaceae bacterium]
MRPRGRRAWIVLPGAALLLLFPAAAAGRASGGYVIEQKEGRSVSRVTLLPQGMRYELLAPPRARRRAKPQVGLILRYRDAHLFLLDPEHRRYDSVSLAAAVSSYRKELAASRKGQPSERLPVRPGTRRTKGQAPLGRPRAHLRRLGLTRTIGGLPARAYLLRQGKLRERLWYSPALSQPPRRVRRLLARAMSGAGAGPFAPALKGEAGRVPMRIDVRRGKRWRRVLRTTRVGRAPRAAVALAPPRGYRERTLLKRPTAGAASVPGHPIRCGLTVVLPAECTLVYLDAGIVGPISEHPDIWSFYWGTHFEDRLDYVSSINHALQDMVGDEFAGPGSKDFWGPLSQYGVGKGRFLGYSLVRDNPPDSVGSWNFFAVDKFVLLQRFGSDAPNYWWRYSDHDPILAIFVEEDQVDRGGWSGYHFFTPTEGGLMFALVHVNMPWFIVKVPSPAKLPDGRDTKEYRQAVDKASQRASHEFVEAATDPYPLTAWADPLKLPPWEEAEIGDICAQGEIGPWGNYTRVVPHGPGLQPYWSNRHGGCVPESRPRAQITFPTGDTTVAWKADATFVVQTYDLYTDKPVLSDPAYHGKITWKSDKDGAFGPNSYVITTSSLSQGVHHITAEVEGDQYGVRVSAPVTVTVKAASPAVRITQPATGSSFGSDQTVTYRGEVIDQYDADLAQSATWSVDGTPVGNGASEFAYKISTEGTHTVTLSATNSAGTSGSDSITVNVGPAEGNPDVMITKPANGSGWGQFDQIEFSATASAQGGATISDSGYSWASDQDGYLGSGQTIHHYLSPGGHNVTVTVTDSLGHTATDTIYVTVGGIG